MFTNTQSRIGLAVVTVLVVCACWAQADIPGFVDYHATWTKDPGAGGYWDVTDPSYGLPEWQVTGQPPFTYPTGRLKVPNQPDPNRVKEVWVEIEWIDPVMVPTTPPPISLFQPTSGVTTLVTAPTASGMGYTWQWHIEPQPAEEWLQMPPYMQALQGIATIEIGTFCATTTVHKPQILYGNLDQNGLGDNTCGPTATANSFAYLERAYPDTYQRKLIPDLPGPPEDDFGSEELEAVEEELENLMGWDPVTGVSIEGLISGKIKYIEAHAPGTTVFDAQMLGEWDEEKGYGDNPGCVTEGTAPTWEWLNEQLLSCEDVEFFIRPVEGEGIGHIMTLTGMTWQDLDNDRKVDEGEASIDYIDPNGGGPGHSDTVGLEPTTETLHFRYDGKEYYIEAAVKESVPEPATMTLLALGGLAVLRRKRRSR